MVDEDGERPTVLLDFLPDKIELLFSNLAKVSDLVEWLVRIQHQK